MVIREFSQVKIELIIMAIVQTSFCFSEFRELFKQYDREDNFTSSGLRALFDYLDDDDTGNVEMDVVAFCCEYSEDTIDELIFQYNIDILDCYGETIPEEEQKEKVRDYLNENTIIVGETGATFVYAIF